mmetsp:Transcript_9380/g.38435  ORF Transcript_9380/g.38435 Transcript_9380/m.38435 type:complete len:87 (-) Transcript_9380:1017-1277(-)
MIVEWLGKPAAVHAANLRWRDDCNNTTCPNLSHIERLCPGVVVGRNLVLRFVERGTYALRLFATCPAGNVLSGETLFVTARGSVST